MLSWWFWVFFISFDHAQALLSWLKYTTTADLITIRLIIKNICQTSDLVCNFILKDKTKNNFTFEWTGEKIICWIRLVKAYYQHKTKLEDSKITSHKFDIKLIPYRQLYWKNCCFTYKFLLTLYFSIFSRQSPIISLWHIKSL